MNEENYGFSNIPAWVASLNPPKDKAPPVELKLNTVNSAESVKDAIVDDATNSQEKATLYTREQLIQMGRIIEDELNDQNITGGGTDSLTPTEVQQKPQQRSLYNQPLSTFRQNNGEDSTVVMNKIASVMQRTSVDGLMQTPDGRFWTEEVNEDGETVLKSAVDPRQSTDDLMSQVVMETMKVNARAP